MFPFHCVQRRFHDAGRGHRRGHRREVLGEKVWRIEGQQNAVWIAMDYVDVVVHIFQTELRGFYRLEELWADAPMTKYEYEE